MKVNTSPAFKGMIGIKLQNEEDFKDAPEVLGYLEQDAANKDVQFAVLPAKNNFIVVTDQSVGKYFDSEQLLNYNLLTEKLADEEEYLQNRNQMFKDDAAKLNKDLNNPISSVRNRALIAKKQLETEKSEFQQEFGLTYGYHYHIAQKEDDNIMKKFSKNVLKDGITKIKAVSLDTLIDAINDGKFDIASCKIKR